MNKLAKAYLTNNVKALDEQFKELDKKMKKIYKKYSTDAEELKKQMALLMYEYEVKEEKLVMTIKERREAKKRINKTIQQMSMEELALEKDLVHEIENLGEDLYKYKVYLLSQFIDLSMIPLDLKSLDKIINTEINGKLWSDRLWHNKQMMMDKLQMHLNKLIRGDTDINKIKQDLYKATSNKRYVTERLWKNELARVQTAIENEVADNYDIEWQLFIATLDGKTSDICRDLDGREFRTNDPNKPNPPTGTHVNCRSALVSIPFKGWKTATRRDNETDEIIPYVKYKEWAKKKED